MSSTITIIQGDDTDFNGNTALKVNINTDIDLTGFKGRFQLKSIVKDYADVTSKSVNIVLTKEETNNLPSGSATGAFKLFDTNGKALTVVKDIPFVILKKQVKNEQ